MISLDDSPLHIGSFWSKQNCRVHDRQGLEGSVGRKRGMIVELSKQIPASQSNADFGDLVFLTFAVRYGGLREDRS